MTLSLPRRGLLLTGLALLATAASAEVPPMTDEQLRQAADLIVIGRVLKVEVRMVTSYPDHIAWRPWYETRLVRADYTVTISSDLTQKGALEPGAKQVVFTASRTVHVPDGWVGGSNTMRVDLHEGDRVKAYLAHHEPGGWLLFHWQGLKVLAKA